MTVRTDPAGHTGADREAQPATKGIAVDDVRGPAQFGAVEELQVRVWGFEPRGVVPVHVLYTVETTGGILLGAYDGGTLVGFVLGFLGRHEGRLYHASHMLGVDPDYQGRGIGELLKQKQRERAREQGLSFMTWTFDPLEARNARFNIHKLVATSNVYCPNLYGNLGDRLNRGLPTDRLVVHWDLRGRLRPVRPSPAQAVPILTDAGGSPRLRLEAAIDGDVLAVAIPDDIQTVKDADPDLAMEWRMAVRKALVWALSHGYSVIDFHDGAYWLTPREPSSGD